MMTVLMLSEGRHGPHSVRWQGDALSEFHAIRSELASCFVLLPTLFASATSGTIPSHTNPDLTKLHTIYHGTVILLYNLVVLSDELGHEVRGVKVEYAKRKIMESSEAIVGIAAMTNRQPNIPAIQPQAMLFVSFWLFSQSAIPR